MGCGLPQRSIHVGLLDSVAGNVSVVVDEVQLEGSAAVCAGFGRSSRCHEIFGSEQSVVRVDFSTKDSLDHDGVVVSADGLQSEL